MAKLSPKPSEIISTRLAADLTQTQAGALVHASYRTWHQWESGVRPMHPAWWELFKLKCIIKD